MTRLKKTRVLDIAAEASRQCMSDISAVDRSNIALRIWNGCVAAGKTIAYETRDGPNTEADRIRTFSELIDPRAERDPIFNAGVEAAPRWKSGRKQGVSFGGVPPSSSVRRFESWPF